MIFRLLRRLAVAAAIAGAVASASAQTPPLAVTAVRNFSPGAYQAHRQNWAVVEDERGILYFGNTAGVLEFDGIYWRRIELPDGRGAYALEKAADGRILVGGEGEIGWLEPDQNGSMHYRSRASILPAAFRASADRVIQILNTPAGQVYLSDDWLFLNGADGTVTALRSADHFLRAVWFQGALHVLDSARGLTRLANGVLEQIAGGGQLRGLTMLVTDAGLLIPDENEGLVLYQGAGSAKPWQVLGANAWSAADSQDVTSAVALQKDRYALGTAKHGVALIDGAGQILQRVGTPEGLADIHVYGMAYDHRGGLWLALDGGLALVGLNLPRDPVATPFHAWVRSVTGTRDDRLLFGGTHSASLGGVQQLAQNLAQRLEFPYKYNAFRFTYAADGLAASGDMEFQTYLEGVDFDWSSWSTSSQREFTELRSGVWTFKVRPRSASGEIGSEGVYSLRILTAWYDTWWFTLVQILFCLFLLVLPSYSRVKHPVLQEGLTNFSIIVPFNYLSGAIGNIIGPYAAGLVFLEVLMNSLLAFVLDPIQSSVKKLVEKLHHKRRHRAKHQHGE